MAADEFDALLQSILQEWNKAEKAIKIAEQIDDEIVTPAIFELRYAGRRLIEALACREQDEAKALGLLSDAEFDCHRARHDAIDAATIKMVGDLTVAEDKIGTGIILSHFADFPKLLRRLFEVRKKVAISRDKRDDRDAIYDTISSGNLDEIVSIFYDFRASEDLMVQLAVKERRAAFRNNVFGYGGLSFGVLSILTSIILYFYS